MSWMLLFAVWKLGRIDLVPKVSFLLRNSFWPLCLYLNWVRFKMYFMHLQVQTLQKNTVVPVCLVIILSGWVSEWHLDFHADRFVSRLVSADICPCGNERQQFSFGFFNIIRKCLLITERAKVFMCQAFMQFEFFWVCLAEFNGFHLHNGTQN